MAKAKIQRKIGTITEIIDETTFKIDIEGLNDFTATISGKIRSKNFELNPKIGDRVLVEYSPYDTSRGRIDYKSFVPYFWEHEYKYFL